MKKLSILVLCFFWCSAFANNRTFEKLTEVNKCWKQQKDIAASSLPAYSVRTEHDWIRTHLALVETTLRNRNTNGLTTIQKQNRLKCLDYLNAYWHEGNFPINEDYAYRTPIFIDKHDNFCAVGYLVKASGNEHISRMIAAKTNLAYVHEMKYPELINWAEDNGFTVDELAWIQPGYPSGIACGKIGNGVEGTVQELAVSEDGQKLYVGGNFTYTGDALLTNNIAYVTESGGVYTWHNIGTGVGGHVNAIATYDNKVFVAGSFNTAGSASANNVAFWNGTSWSSAGCLNGTVKDLIVFEGNLYAAGNFTSCSSMPGSSFAKWDGSAWQLIPGITGVVNTLEVTGSSLLLGGAFSYAAMPVNAIKWAPTTSFAPLVGNLNNEVTDFAIFEDTMYAVCKRTHATDTATLFMKLRNDGWVSAFSYSGMYESLYSPYGTLSFNTLCAEGSMLNMAGQFIYSPMMGTSGVNCYNIGEYGNWVSVDSEVNKMVLFKGQLIVGGKFKTGGSGGWGGSVELNGITRRSSTTSIPSTKVVTTKFNIYPNPVRTGSTLTLENNFDANHYVLHHVTGKVYAEGKLDKNHQIRLQQIPTGMYIITLDNGAGDKEVRKIIVE